MSFELSEERQRMKWVNRGRRQLGEVPESQHPVRPLETGAAAEMRANARFEDQTGVALLGWGGMGTWMIGGEG